MSSAAPRPLTPRQRAVMERIDRRIPIKVIAQELGVSETRINQHIRALKDNYDAENLGELVERHRAANPIPESEIKKPERSEKPTEKVAGARSDSSVPQPQASPEEGLSNSVYSKSQVPAVEGIGETLGGNDPGELVMSDILPLVEQAPWLRPGEPKVVPRVLDGEYAVWFRLAAIVGIAFGLLGAVVLTVTAAMTISEALDGKATVPVDEQGFS